MTHRERVLAALEHRQPDRLIVKNCGAYAAEQMDRLLAMLHDRRAQFFRSRQIAEAHNELHSR